MIRKGCAAAALVITLALFVAPFVASQTLPAPAGSAAQKVGIRSEGKAIGIDPATGPTFPVYANRDAVSDWEEAELTPHASGQFDVRFITTNRQLTITPDGRLESRPGGSVGAWELLYATQQPDGSALLYRLLPGGVPSRMLTIEARP